MRNAFECSNDFIRIDIALLTCERFQALSRTAQLVLIDFIGRYRSVKNARISFPFKSRLNKGIGRTAFVTAVNELCAAGFLDKDHRNGARATYCESRSWRSCVVENRAGIQTDAATEGEAEACRKSSRSEAEGELKPCRKSTRTVPEIDTDRAGNRHGPCRKADRDRAGKRTSTVPEIDTDRAGKRHAQVDQIKRSPLPPTDDPVLGRDGAAPHSPSGGSPAPNETIRVEPSVIAGPCVADPPSGTHPRNNGTIRAGEAVVSGDQRTGRRHPAPGRGNGALAVAFLED